jgi:thiamine-phosphate diphosphorylase
VHLGQHDLPVADARATLKPWQLAGASNALVDEAVVSASAGADYLAVGAMFPSGSKSNTRHAGPETLRRVRQAIPPGGPPLVAIGGITRENVAQMAQAGADTVCVIGAVTQAENPRQAAEALLAAFRDASFK